MNDLEELATLARTWHRKRFPDAQVTNVTLKLCEEVGEVARAINGHCGNNSATGGGDVGGEAADVLIVLLVLLERWFPEVNLATEVRTKMAVLNNPASGHRASLPTTP